MNPEFVFADTLAGVTKGVEREPAVIASDNPLLAHDPRAGAKVKDVSVYLGQSEASRLGKAAIDMLLALDRALDRQEAAVRFGGLPGPLNVTLPLRALAATLVHRGLMLQRALDEFGPGTLVLAIPDQPRWLPSLPWNMPRFACPYRSLAEEGFFSNRAVEVVSVPYSPPTDFNDTASDDLLLKLLLVPFSQAAFEALKRLGVVKFNGRAKVAIGKPCETLSETLPWLALRGLKFGKFALPAYAGPRPPPFGAPVDVDPWLQETAGALLVEHLTRLGVFSEHAARSIARIILQHLAAGLAGLRETTRAIATALDATFPDAGEPKVLATSGIYGPMGTQLLALCRAKGIILVDFEHGATTGIASTSERRLDVSEAASCDVLMASSARAARSFARANGHRPAIHVIGIAAQARKIRHRPLQRWRARRKLSLGRNDTAVIHVSTLLYGGNMRPGDDAPVERYVFATEAALLKDVYPAVAKTVLYKAYPAQRYPHHASYADLFALAPNIRLIDRADFRYVRAAADIIVTQANSSTIGWCVGADVPLVHLGSRDVHALVDDALRAEFAAAFFTVDMDRPDWAEALRALLSRDIEDLRSEWEAKRPSRERLIDEGIAGPPGTPGRRAARIIANVHAQ
jgi:hypothetical protein